MMKKGVVEQIIQVCWELNSDNDEREIKGLTEAFDYFKRREGVIIIYNQKEMIRQDGHTIHVVLAYDYLTRIMYSE